MSDLPVSRADYDLLKAALEPFARMLPEFAHRPDSAIIAAASRTAMITVGDLRAAAEVYNHEPVPVAMVRHAPKLQPYRGRVD